MQDTHSDSWLVWVRKSTLWTFMFMFIFIFEMSLLTYYAPLGFAMIIAGFGYIVLACRIAAVEPLKVSN